MKISSFIFATVISLVGCENLNYVTVKPSIKPIGPAVFIYAKGDVEKLWNNWIVPQFKIININEVVILQPNQFELIEPTQNIIVSELDKFCQYSGGYVIKNYEKVATYGDFEVTCEYNYQTFQNKKYQNERVIMGIFKFHMENDGLHLSYTFKNKKYANLIKMRSDSI